jgi:hypothetical protein
VGCTRVRRGVDEQARQAVALVLVVASAPIAIPTYLTGEPAEHLLSEADPANFSHELSHAHEEMAEKAFIASEVAGALALITLIRWRVRWVLPRRRRPSRWQWARLRSCSWHGRRIWAAGSATPRFAAGAASPRQLRDGFCRMGVRIRAAHPADAHGARSFI